MDLRLRENLRPIAGPGCFASGLPVIRACVLSMSRTRSNCSVLSPLLHQASSRARRGTPRHPIEYRSRSHTPPVKKAAKFGEPWVRTVDSRTVFRGLWVATHAVVCRIVLTRAWSWCVIGILGGRTAGDRLWRPQLFCDRR